MTREQAIKRGHKIEVKWAKYKSLRSYPYQCAIGHPDFITPLKREQMLEDMLGIFNVLTDD